MYKYEYEKEVTGSESKYKNVAEVTIIKKVEKKTGGAQASYNIPNEMFAKLIDENILVDKDMGDLFEGRNKEIPKSYFLSDNYDLELSNNVLGIISSDKSKKSYGFFVIYENGNKPQMRKTLYKSMDENGKDDKNYTWFIDLYENNSENNKMIYKIDTTTKKLFIDIEVVSDAQTENNYYLSSEDTPVEENSNVNKKTVQKILFGPPGTGKSYNANELVKESYPSYRSTNENPYLFRVTVFPDYSYHDFIGSIMPIVENDGNGDENKIKYEFLPGIFTKALIKAYENPNKDVYLIIEEMTRGNIAAIFGDVFQLLDRTKDGSSEFSIKNYMISDELKKRGFSVKHDAVTIPKNLNIIGTVNTSDQNVYVIDTAFKRRFDFEYVDLDPVKNKKTNEYINNGKFCFTIDGKDTELNWIDFYQIINKYIVEILELNEDKQLGQFFIKFNNPNNLEENYNILKNKLLDYLWNDVQKASLSGKKIFKKEYSSFSKLYKDFSNKINVFNDNIEFNN